MKDFWKSTRRWLPGVLISLVAIAAILYFIDLQRFGEAIRSANYWLLLIVFACSMIWLAVRGIVWRTILRERASYRDVFLTLCEGYLLNNFLPFRLGEIGRAFLLGRKSKLGFMEVLPTIIIERILDLAFAAAILLSAVPFVVGAAGAGKIAMLIGGMMVVGLIILYLMARNRDWAMGQFNRLTALSSRLQKIGGDFLASLFSGLSILTDGRLFLRVLFWMALNWAIAIINFYILLLAFFPQATPLWSLFGSGFVALGNAIPSLPGAVGTFEGAFIGAVTILSGDQSTALAAALTSHLFNYLSTGIIGLYALSREGETLMGIYRQLRKRQVSLRGSPAETDEEIFKSAAEIASVAPLARNDTELKE
jgi:glycosyltransferase 2 family protein